MKIEKFIIGSYATNSYLVTSGDNCAVIDPGENCDFILNKINAGGAKLIYIINTHYHFDHTLSNIDLKKATGAEILIHEAEKEFIDFRADKFLKEGDIIKIGDNNLQVLSTPGHSAGSICLLGENIIFTGDTVFADGYGRTDLAGGSDKAMAESLKKLKEIIQPGTTVYPGHGDIFTV
jgi:hydroxyacylglutathione hydrolase